MNEKTTHDPWNRCYSCYCWVERKSGRKIEKGIEMGGKL